MRVLSKFRSSDGRIKIATLSGVSVLVAVIALLVGVLPAVASDGGTPSTKGIAPQVVDWGGGSGACFDDLNSIDDGTARGPSAARYELHINNPTNGLFTDPIGGGRVELLNVSEDDKLFDFRFVDESGDPVSMGEPGTMAAYDVVVNGGAKSDHYDYDAAGDPVIDDGALHAPPKGGSGETFNLSHVNICYDVAPVTFACDDPVTLEGEGLIKSVTAEIFTNSVDNTFDCTSDKQAFYFIDNDTVTLDFGDDEPADVVGRLDFTKDFGDPTSAVPLTYDRDDTGTFLDVQWCDVRDKAGDGTDGEQFDEELSTTRYPSLVGVKDTDGKDATACKVFEDLNAEGIQHTVVYFEFVDPQFR